MLILVFNLFLNMLTDAFVLALINLNINYINM